MEHIPITVVETDRFLKDVKHLMPESEQLDSVAFVAANPQAGDLIPETGGYGGCVGRFPAKGREVARE